MIIVLRASDGDPGEGFLFYGPYEDCEEVKEKSPLWDWYNGDFWYLESEALPNTPPLSAAEWRATKGDLFVAIDVLETGFRIVGPFTEEAAAAAWIAAHPRTRTLSILRPEPAEATAV